MCSESGMNSKIKSYTEADTGGRLTRAFFTRDVLFVAPDIIGKILVFKSSGNSLKKYMITETEAYRGPEDKACHASRGRTPRTEVMFDMGGKIYVYFVYGMYWMLNFVTGVKNNPQAVLIRAIEGCNGPGKLTKVIGIDRSFYGEDLTTSDRIWVEDSGSHPKIKAGCRIGVDYAGEYWKNVPWRYTLDI